MKKILLNCLCMLLVATAFSQTTYYWVGGVGPTSFSAGTNWNTALNGSGSSRTTADTTDILIFNGSNVGGATPATGTVTVTITSLSIGQLKLESNANVVFTRTGGGTGTSTITSGPGDDLTI